jgi:uncharacterized membrane protein YcaP (DUF421 family)
LCKTPKWYKVKKEEIHLWDIKRILFGQAPPEFLLEVLIRSIVIYLLAIITMRWLGKRMNGQLTNIELAVVVMMGAILAVPMQIPDRGLLQGLVVLVTVLLIYRGINLIAFKNSRFEKVLQGEMRILVKDGVLQLDTIDAIKLSKPQLYVVLRSKQIYNLGKVKRMYLEGCGTYSIYNQEEDKPGLLLLPKEDEAMLPIQKTVDDALVCANCGYVQKGQDNTMACPNCKHTEWSKPII